MSFSVKVDNQNLILIVFKENPYEYICEYSIKGYFLYLCGSKKNHSKSKRKGSNKSINCHGIFCTLRRIADDMFCVVHLSREFYYRLVYSSSGIDDTLKRFKIEHIDV